MTTVANLHHALFPRPTRRSHQATRSELLGNRYRLLGELGRGGMGVVYEAIHEALGQPVAIKFLADFAGDSSSDTFLRFVREARTAANLRSPHVARVVDIGTSEEQPFIVMELLDGEDLSKVLARCGRLPVEDAVSIILQVCDAMIEAHALGIVHRDLKPANLFLTRTSTGEPFVKVLDFGLAKVTFGDGASRTSSDMIFGTPRHMAPEQIRATGTVDGRADVWSMGVVLYQLLTGESAFEGPNAPSVFANVLTQAPRPISLMRPEVPAALERVVLQCLEKDPAARMPSAKDLAAALAPFAPSPGGERRTSGDSSSRSSVSEAPVVVSTDLAPALPPSALSDRAWRAVVVALGTAAFLFGLVGAVAVSHRGSVTVTAARPVSAVEPVPRTPPVASAAPVALEEPPSLASSAPIAALPPLPPPRPKAKHLDGGGRAVPRAGAGPDCPIARRARLGLP